MHRGSPNLGRLPMEILWAALPLNSPHAAEAEGPSVDLTIYVVSSSGLPYNQSLQGNAMVDRSLYYPYIHIRDIDWLKTTLLFFSQVRRMAPSPGAQADDDDQILPFTQPHGGRKDPMVVSTDLFSKRPEAAQIALAERLIKD